MLTLQRFCSKLWYQAQQSSTLVARWRYSTVLLRGIFGPIDVNFGPVFDPSKPVDHWHCRCILQVSSLQLWPSVASVTYYVVNAALLRSRFHLSVCLSVRLWRARAAKLFAVSNYRTPPEKSWISLGCEKNRTKIFATILPRWGLLCRKGIWKIVIFHESCFIL